MTRIPRSPVPAFWGWRPPRSSDSPPAGRAEQTPAAGPADIGGTMVVATPAEAQSAHAAAPGGRHGQARHRSPVRPARRDRDALNTVGDKGFKPRLAERWEWAADSLSIVFHLNPRARWHDGQPVRASDVRYSLALIKDPAVRLARDCRSSPTSTRPSVRDSLTVVACFKQRTPEQFYDLAYQVLDRSGPHLPSIRRRRRSRPPTSCGRALAPAASASRSGMPGKRLELVADTANYRGRAKLDRVVFTPTLDFNSSVAQFFSGDADLFPVLRPEHLPRIAKDTARRAVRYPSLQYTYLVFNLIDPAQTGQPHPIFGDRCRPPRAVDGGGSPRHAAQRVRHARRAAVRPLSAAR